MFFAFIDAGILVAAKRRDYRSKFIVRSMYYKYLEAFNHVPHLVNT